MKELAGTTSQEHISQFWNDNLRRLLPLAKTSDDPMLLKQSQSVLLLPLKAVNKFWHNKRCDWIQAKRESYRLGLTMCAVCKLNMVKVIGGKCLRPEHANVDKSKKEKRKRDAEAKRKSKEKAKDITCGKCNCSLYLNPVTREVVDRSKSKRCKVSGHQFLDVTRLTFDDNGICDACNRLAGGIGIVLMNFNLTNACFVVDECHVYSILTSTVCAHDRSFVRATMVDVWISDGFGTFRHMYV